MTAIGKLLALLNLVVGIALLTWATNLYVQRPGWFNEPPTEVDKGNSPVGFKQLKVETEARAIKRAEIRDSVQSELFFLSTFEVNVFETRETVFRRERQLRNRLKGLGLVDP